MESCTLFKAYVTQSVSPFPKPVILGFCTHKTCILPQCVIFEICNVKSWTSNNSHDEVKTYMLDVTHYDHPRLWSSTYLNNAIGVIHIRNDASLQMGGFRGHVVKFSDTFDTMPVPPRVARRNAKIDPVEMA